MQARRGSYRTEGGFTYLGILIAIALIGITLAEAGTLWSFVAQRDREAQLLFVGDQYRNAIAHYYATGAGANRYPQELEDLLLDSRSVQPRRYLRRLYPDPMTGQADWTLLRNPDGGIYGVASSSAKAPLKRANFRGRDEKFTGAECYCDWRFEYTPSRTQLRARQPDNSLSAR